MSGYVKITPFLKRAITNCQYYPTYAGFGTTAFLLAIYVCEWKTVGQYIPVWSTRYTDK